MLEAVASIGRLTSQKSSGLDDLVDSVVNATHLVKLVIKNIASDDYFLETEEFRKETPMRILLKNIKGNVANPSISCSITDFSGKTYSLKVLGFCDRVLRESENLGLGMDEISKISELKEFLLRNEVHLKEEVEEIRKEMGSKARLIFTVTFMADDDEEVYPADDPVFRKIFVELISLAENRFGGHGTCSICGQEGVVLGGVSPYKFFNLDKEGFLFGFDKNWSYKNFPICPECLRHLKNGKSYVESKLTYQFYGRLDYRLIPQSFMGDEVLLEVLETLEEQAYRSLGDKRFIANFTADERELVETVLKECGDSVSFNFLFIEVTNAAEKIKCFIPDVLPSRISVLHDAAQYVHDTMTAVLKPQDPNDRRTDFAFGTMARFFYSGDSYSKRKRSDKEFLDLVDRVFKGRKIDRTYFFERLSQGISRAFKDAIQDSSKKSDFYFATLDALRTMLFVSYLNLIGDKSAEVNRVDERKYDWFFEQFQSSFSEPYAKGLFLLGAASQLIIQAQDAMGRSGSIASSLKDLRMKEEDFKELVPKLRAKIDQLGASLGSPSASGVGGNVGALLYMAKDYLTEASYYILQAGDYWNASTGELNFYFACGMNLAWEPRRKKDEMQTAEEEE